MLNKFIKKYLLTLNKLLLWNIHIIYCSMGGGLATECLNPRKSLAIIQLFLKVIQK